MQEIDVALHLALERAGNNMAAKMAMMAITTSNSIKVKPGLHFCCQSRFKRCVFAFMKLFLILSPFKKSRYLIIRSFFASVKRSSQIQSGPARLPNLIFYLSGNSKSIILLMKQ